MLSWLWWPSEGTPWSSFTETLSHTTARFVPSFFTLHSSLFTVNSFAFLASLFWTEVRFLCFVLIEIECVEPLGLNARTSRHCCAFSHDAMYSQYLPSPFTFRSRVCESLFIFLCSSLGRKTEMDPRVFGLRKLMIRYALKNIAYVFPSCCCHSLAC